MQVLQNKSVSCDLLSVYLALSLMRKFTAGSAPLLPFLVHVRLVLKIFDTGYNASFHFLLNSNLWYIILS